MSWTSVTRGRTLSRIFSAFLALALVSVAQPAWSCKCVTNAPQDDRGRKKRNGVVFWGTATSWTCAARQDERILALGFGPSCLAYQSEFLVGATWKGNVSGKVIVRAGGADCGTSFTPGESYVVFAAAVPGKDLEVATGMCLGSHKSSLDEALRSVGKLPKARR